MTLSCLLLKRSPNLFSELKPALCGRAGGSLVRAFILPLESSCLVIESHLVTIDSDLFRWERYIVEKPGSTPNPFLYL